MDSPLQNEYGSVRQAISIVIERAIECGVVFSTGLVVSSSGNAAACPWKLSVAAVAIRQVTTTRLRCIDEWYPQTLRISSSADLVVNRGEFQFGER